MLPNLFLWIALAALLSIWWSRHRGRPVGRWAFAGIAVVWLLAARPVAELLIWPLESRFEQPAPVELEFRGVRTVVVLNGSSHVPRPDSITTSLEPGTSLRFLAGLELCSRLGPDCRVAFSGSAGAGRRGLPAFENLTRLALYVAPERATTSESESGNVAQHPEHVSRLVQDEPFVLVTSAHLLPRAMRSFRRHGLQPMAYPVDFRRHGDYGWLDWLPSAEAAATSQTAFREYLAWTYYAVMGR